MRRGLQPPAPAAPPPAPSTDSRAAPAGFPARFAAGTFIQIRSTGAVAAAAGAPCVVSAAAASQAPGAFAPAADGGQPAGSSLYCTPHGPAGRTALLQPALGGGGGRPPVILFFPPSPREGEEGRWGISARQALSPPPSGPGGGRAGEGWGWGGKGGRAGKAEAALCCNKLSCLLSHPPLPGLI